jgi:hypothetical protein
MAESVHPSKTPADRFKRWLLQERIEEIKGPEAKESEEQHPWWQVVCLTGVDYFSTLGYIPGIAALAAGALSPIATLLIVGLTLLGMLPMYRVVAEESPHGQGSIAMLEDLLSFWRGKVLVLILLGFVATAWLVTITLSAADATAHVVENPLVPTFLHGQRVAITLLLLVVLGAVFLKGFREAIGIAVFIVAAYLVVNLVVVAVGLYESVTEPQSVNSWSGALFANYGNPLAMIGVSLLVFPRLALGLSGFETGVGMMPLVRGEEDDDPTRPAGRIRNTRKMLTVAALIMSFYLITTSFVTTVLIPPEEFQPGGSANGRALAYLAHNLRPEHHNHTVVRGGFRDGRALEHRAAVSAPLRHGAGVGTGGEAPGDGLHRCRGRHHDHLPCRRGRAGRCLRHGSPGDDDLGRLRRGADRLAQGIEAGRARVRGGSYRVRLCPLR